MMQLASSSEVSSVSALLLLQHGSDSTSASASGTLSPTSTQALHYNVAAIVQQSIERQVDAYMRMHTRAAHYNATRRQRAAQKKRKQSTAAAASKVSAKKSDDAAAALTRLERRMRRTVETQMKQRLIRLWFGSLWERPVGARALRHASPISRTALREAMNTALRHMGFSRAVERKNALWSTLVLRELLSLSSSDCRSSSALMLIDRRSTYACTEFWRSVCRLVDEIDAQLQMLEAATTTSGGAQIFSSCLPSEPCTTVATLVAHSDVHEATASAAPTTSTE